MRDVKVRFRAGLGMAAVAGLCLLPASGAAAQVRTQTACGPYPALSCPPPTVVSSGGSQKPDTDPTPEVAAQSSGTLAFTGLDVIELGGIALASIGLGAVMVRRSRARHSAD